MHRYLTILEVSQKQAYIFAINKLAECAERSNAIAYITSHAYINKAVNDANLYSEEKNFVYQGGGHTILVFESEDTSTTNGNSEDSAKAVSREVVKRVTMKVAGEYPEIELFAKTVLYCDNPTDLKENETIPAWNIRHLTEQLEKKKAMRKNAFHSSFYGIEKLDPQTRKPAIVWKNHATKPVVPNSYNKNDVPEDFAATYKFEKLGGSKGEADFIAVVHIDGNSMSKRVDDFSSRYTSWEEYRKNIRIFSESIAKDFDDSYMEMIQLIGDEIRKKDSRIVAELDLCKEKGKYYFPIRRIIAEGDDVTFVTEGRIGIEAAAACIKFLTRKDRKNAEDEQNYHACAGVAIVHSHYPFYRAYELAEELCHNAKSFCASFSLQETDLGADMSAIDWHIEFGEIREDLAETRKVYDTMDGKHLELRPYIIDAPEEKLAQEPIRRYENFRALMDKLNDSDFFGSSIIKEFRGALKQGEQSAQHFLRFHEIENTMPRDSYFGIFKDVNYDQLQIGRGKQERAPIFVRTHDGEERSVLFDGIEAMKTYLKLED